MAFSRALLLKGLGGVAAVGAVGVGGYGVMYPNKFKDIFKSQSQINEEKNKRVGEVNEKLKTLGLSEEVCKLKTSDFTTSQNYSKDCVLDKDKFQKIKFFDGEQATGTIDGWTGENNVKLTISDKSDGGIKFLFKDVKDDLTISKTGDQANEKVTIKKEKETEFKEENGKLVKLVDQDLKTKLEGINKKMADAGLPSDCSFDVTEKDKELECGLDGNKLKTIKFSNKGSAETLTVTGAVGSNLKIKVELGGNNDPSFSFTGLSEDLTILGENTKGKIVIKRDEKRTFRVEGEKLEKVPLNDQALSAKLKKFNQQLSTLSLPNDCRFDEAEQDKVLECGLDANSLKAIKFSNRGDSGTLTLSSETIQGSLKVKVEVKDDDEAHFSFTGLTQDLSIYGDSAKGKIILKHANGKEFKVVEEKLEKVSGDSDKAVKLGVINATMAGINLPNKCLFDVGEEDSSSECELSLDEFKAIKLTSKADGEALTVSSNPAPTKMKLKVELKNEGNQGDEIIYTLSGLDQKLKFGKTGEEIFLEANKPYEFEVREGKLGPERKLKTNTLGISTSLFATKCSYSDSIGNKGTCKANNFINIMYMDGNTEKAGSVSWDNGEENFDFLEYQEGYGEGIKFTYKGENHCTMSDGKEIKIEKGKSYELKEKESNWYLKEKS